MEAEDMTRKMGGFGVSVILVAVGIFILSGTSFALTNLICDSTGCAVDFADVADSCTAYSGPVGYSQLPSCGIEGWVIKWSGTSWGCGQDSTGVSYTQGTGILINAGSISADIGTGATQVAAGNHGHNGSYVKSGGDTMSGNLSVLGTINASNSYALDSFTILSRQSNTLALGYYAGGSITTGGANTFLGESAGNKNDAGSGNTFAGFHAGMENTSGNNNTFLGINSGKLNTAGAGLTLLGASAGMNNTGSNNTFVGYLSGEANLDGANNTFLGESSGRNNTSGFSNVFLGTSSGFTNLTGRGNVFIGDSAGNSSSASQYSVLIGHEAARDGAVGDYNVIIGDQAGINNAGSRNVFIGNKAGSNETGSNRLHIDTANLASSLIYGEFDTRLVRINGNFDVTGTISGSITSSATINLNTTPSTASGVLSYDPVNDSIGIGDGATTDYFYPGFRAGSGSNGGPATAALALNTDPAACASGSFVTDIAASGTLTCASSSSNFTISGGSINNTQIGNTTASTGTFTALTAIGNVTFDTSTFKVDATNNRVGIGTATPENKLHITGGEYDVAATEGDLKIGDATNRLKIGVATGGGGAGISRIHAAGTLPKVILGAGGTDVLTTTSTGVGIGTLSPAEKLDVVGTAQVSGNTAIGTTINVGRKLNVLAGGNDIAGYFEANYVSHSAGSKNYAAYNSASGAETNYGALTLAADSSAAYNYGVYGIAEGGQYNIAFRGEAIDSTASFNYGVHATASYGGAAYGIYASASGATTNYAGYFSGNLAYTGTISDLSDERLKENIRPVENALVKVAAINGVYFNMKETPDQTEVGVIAQDVQKVLPEAVSIMDPANGYLGVSYPSLIPVLIEAVKEQQAEIKELRAALSELTRRMAAMEAAR
ncbi:MAG: hypothetical protein C0402_08845 [Thermodesulfovibrio sp.]|nr:hypothetical protein [Thermodesulfovibrio sp.]